MTTKESADRSRLLDVGYGIAFVAVAASFWVQRDYADEKNGLFPDAILVSMAILGVTLAIRGLIKPTKIDREGRPSRNGILRALGLLAAWFAALVFVGYVAAGIIFFTLTATLMRREGVTLKGLAIDAAVATVVVMGIYFLFTEILMVRLPTP